jgi:hypothetical protein
MKNTVGKNNIHQKYHNELKHIVEFLTLFIVSIGSVGLIPHVIKVISSQDVSETMLAAFYGALVPIIFIGFVRIYKNYTKISRLEMSLFTEIGLIAKALFHDVSTNNGVNSNILETFNVNHSIIHSVGSDIAILDSDMVRDVLEFHSLMKVLLNVNKAHLENTDTVNIRVLKRIAKIVSRNPIAQKAIQESHTAYDCMENYIQ